MHDLLLIGPGGLEDPGDPPMVEDGDAVGQSQDLGEFGADQNDSDALRREFPHDRIDRELRADVDPACRFVEEEQSRPAKEPFSR